MIKRREGYLGSLTSGRFPKRLLFFDTETYVNKDDNGYVKFPLRLGVMVFIELDNEGKIKKRAVSKFKSIEDFISSLQIYMNKKAMLYLFAHNVGFDIRVLNLPQEFNRRGFISEPPIVNNRRFLWKVKSDYGSLQFLDTSNYGVLTVDQLGKDLGFSKGEVDFNTSNEAELFEYCLRDVEILEKFILNYITYIIENELGGFRSTLASQSLACFRTKFMHNPPYIHLDDTALKIEREGYHGGRTECFRIGEFSNEDFYYLDVNSMYPFCMSDDNLPYKYLGKSYINPLNYLPIRSKNFYLIAKVVIETNEPVYPVVMNNKLVFPIGRFETILYHPELIYAYNHGHIREIKLSLAYEKGQVFNEYVDFFYNEKVKHSIDYNASYRYISKLYLNSLYGKFGQLETHRILLQEGEDNEVWRIPYVDGDSGLSFQEFGWYGDIYREFRDGETLFSNPALAGSITSMARMRLWEFMKSAGLENVYYCDTDSIITNQEGYNNLLPFIDDNKLGYLALEKTSRNLSIFGNKDYVFGKDIRVKGVPSKAIKTGENEWEYLQFQGFITWLNNGAVGFPDGQYRIKRRVSSYNKGIVDEKGNVSPFIIFSA